MTGYSNNSCNVNEYKYMDICCPRCKPGDRLQEHCTQNSGTNCESCVNDTYQSDFNAGKECIKCTICEEGATEIKPCSSTRDTVCNCTEGHYCPNITKDGCRKCLKHRVCSASEPEVRKGTSSTDTECQPCANGICSQEGKTNIGNTAENLKCQTIIIILSAIVAFILY
ncbi:tumor necrosis factor receptor superfamily member 14-like [Rhinoraja longicauda]